MPLLFRSILIAGAVTLSTLAFAGNQEGNKPLNNVMATVPQAPEMSPPETRAAATTPYSYRHHYRYRRGPMGGEMDNSQPVAPQSNY